MNTGFGIPSCNVGNKNKNMICRIESKYAHMGTGMSVELFGKKSISLLFEHENINSGAVFCV